MRPPAGPRAAWRDASLAKRTSVLFAFRELLHARRDELAAAITAEHGKVLADAAGEVQRGLEVVEYACGIPALLRGGFSENVSTEVDSYSIRQPLGVVAVISPFNFPAMVPLWFVPIAIACGNAVVLKPSEKDPTAPTLLAEWFAEAGLPDGVFNVVHGDKEAVDALLDHPTVRRSRSSAPPRWRGTSTSAARRPASGCRRSAARRTTWWCCPTPTSTWPPTRRSTPASARRGSGAWRSPSWSRSSRSRDELVGADRRPDGRHPHRRRPARLRHGPAGHRRRTGTGWPSYVDAGAAAGATVVVDGRDVTPDGGRGGFWLGPTLFDQVTPEMSIYTDEIFGPVLSVVRAGSYDEALALVNANPYGNGTAIFTNDGGAARRFQHEVEVGMVGVNVPIPVPMAYYSFGGWKASLFGDTHAHGADGVHFFTRGKVVTSRWLDPRHGGVNLGFPTQT